MSIKRRFGVLVTATSVLLAMSRCGGATEPPLSTAADGAAEREASTRETSASDGATAIDADSTSDGDASASNGDASCWGPATFDMPSEQWALAICHAPACKICVQSLDANGMPYKWAAYQMPPECPCPAPTGGPGARDAQADR